MAKLKDITKLTSDELNKVLNKALTPEFVESIGKFIAADIKKRTKLGYGVEEPGGAQSKLKPLSDEYKKYRKGKTLGESGSPAKSNLTFTGNMLNDFVVSVSKTTASIALGSDESRKKEQWQREQGRTFFNVSKTQITMITKMVKDKIKSILGN